MGIQIAAFLAHCRTEACKGVSDGDGFSDLRGVGACFFASRKYLSCSEL